MVDPVMWCSRRESRRAHAAAARERVEAAALGGRSGSAWSGREGGAGRVRTEEEDPVRVRVRVRDKVGPTENSSKYHLLMGIIFLDSLFSNSSK